MNPKWMLRLVLTDKVEYAVAIFIDKHPDHS